MEKFQMLFPYSSTGSSNVHVFEDQVDHHHHLKIDNHHDHDLSSLIPNNNDQLMMMMSSSDQIGSMELVESHEENHHHDHDQITKGRKVKGDIDEKKKMRKARYAFQTRTQVDILDDGYRWRKYGQKAVKNNKFPRSYYRCTYQGCSVKKQVQRLTKDEGVVVTTYEGTHSHPIQTPTDNFEHILNQMQIYTPF